MKKIIVLFNILIAGILLFNACDPTKDYRNDYNFYNDPSKVKFPDSTTVYTLTSTDYTKSSVSAISTNKYFSETYPVLTYLPEILNNSFNAKPSSLMTIVYNYNSTLVLRDSVTYTLTSTEYGSGTYYSKITDVYGYLTKNYPLARRGATVILTYKNSATTTITSTFVNLGTSWIVVLKLVAADYTTMGQSYADFTTTTDAQFYISVFLNNNTAYTYAKSGDIVLVQYVLYVSGKSTQTLVQFTYNGTAWIAANSVNPSTQTVFFTGTAWKCTPTFSQTTDAAARSYTLTDADYTLVGNGQYKDFDTRSVGPEGNINVLLNKIGKILLTRFPEIITGNQVIFAVTFTNYNGTTGPATINVKVIPQ